ncbi:hypothetical protein TrST_g2151 [Triparma strigata]|uniref:Uncharacterized protein n=1 Tax=Triparma strigata TaxID=1606541 RepID=A0A9W7BPE1_9STRA|nr:hypothetical protein TrST_g2151 [Triparma strigata]
MTHRAAYNTRLAHVKEKLALPLLLLPGTASRHNLLDSLLSSHLLLLSTGQDSLADTSKLDDYAIFIDADGITQVLMPTVDNLTSDKVTSNCDPSVILRVPTEEERFGVSIDGGIRFQERVLRHWLAKLENINICVPPGYDSPDEALERYKIFDGDWYEGVVSDVSEPAWRLLCRVDALYVDYLLNSRLSSLSGVMGQVAYLFKKTKDNASARKAIDLVVANDIVDEFYNLGKVINGDRRKVEMAFDIESALGRGGNPCRVLFPKQMELLHLKEDDPRNVKYQDDILTLPDADTRLGSASCYVVDVTDPSSGVRCVRTGWLSLGSEGYFPEVPEDDDDDDDDDNYGANELPPSPDKAPLPPPVPTAPDHTAEYIKAYNDLMTSFASIGEKLGSSKNIEPEKVEAVITSALPKHSTITCTLLTANNLPVPSNKLERGGYLVAVICSLEVGEVSVAYGETFDCTGFCITSQVDPYNCCMNAPWEEWRSEKLEAGHLVEDRFDDKADIGKLVDSGTGKWAAGNYNFEGRVEIREKGLILTDPCVGSIVIRWHLNVGSYALKSGVLRVKVLNDIDSDANPLRGVLGGLIIKDIYLAINLDKITNMETSSHDVVRMWQDVRKVKYDAAAEEVGGAGRGRVEDRLSERLRFDVEMLQGDVVVSEPQGGAEVVFVVGRYGSSVNSLTAEISSSFGTVIYIEGEGEGEERVEFGKLSGRCLVVIYGLLSPVTMISEASLCCTVLGVTCVVNWSDVKCDGGLSGELEYSTLLHSQCSSTYVTSVLIYTAANTRDEDLEHQRELTTSLLKMSPSPDIWRSTQGSLDIDIKDEICNGSGKFYSADRVQSRRSEVIVGLVRGLSPENEMCPFRKFKFDFEVDCESICIILQELLRVDFKAISSVLATTEDNAGGWRRKALATGGGGGGGNKGWLKRTLTLARFKVESEIIRKHKLEKLRRGIEEWRAKFDAIGEAIISGVGGNFKSDNKTIAAVGNYGWTKSLHLSLGNVGVAGAGEGLVLYGKGLSTAHFDSVMELFRLAEVRSKFEKRELPNLGDIDREKIGKEYKHLELPDDWQFDGKAYIDFTGGKKRLRPDIDEIVQMELEKRSDYVARWNESVEELDEDMLGVMKMFQVIKC